MVTAKANASANGGMIQGECNQTGNAWYCIQEAIISGMVVFSVSTSTLTTQWAIPFRFTPQI